MRYAINKHKFLSEREVLKLEETLRITRHTDTRNSLMVELGLKSGARASELLAIEASDLSDESETVFIRGLKSSDDREIGLTSEFYRRLKIYAESIKGRLFPIGYDRLYQIWKDYTPNPNKSIHSLRHTFAIRLYQKEKDILLVKYALGHRNIQNTMIYAQYIQAQSDFKRMAL